MSRVLSSLSFLSVCQVVDKQQSKMLQKLESFLGSSRNAKMCLENATWLVGVLMKVSVELSTIMNVDTERCELPEVAAYMRVAVGSGGRTAGGKTAGGAGEGAAFSVVTASGKGLQMLGTAMGSDKGDELKRAADGMATGPLVKGIRAVVNANDRR